MALETLSWLAPLPAVSCGYVHTLLLGRCNGAEQGGQLFAFGSDMLRQLGLGSGGSRGEESQTTDMLPVGAVDDIEPAPLPVARLAPGQIVSIAAGQCHSAAVTTTGQLFLWGQELGRPLENEENRFVATPRPVSSGFPSCTRVVQRLWICVEKGARTWRNRWRRCCCCGCCLSRLLLSFPICRKPLMVSG